MSRRRGKAWKRAAAITALGCAAFAPPALGRERGADGRFERRDSSHFALFQDVDIDRASGWRGSVRFEREVLATLERGYDDLEALLGLRPERKLEVFVYDPGLFDAQFARLFGFRVAGFYAGAIRVRGDVAVTVALSRTLHHELVHAAFAAAAPSLVLPAWLNEGTAEWFENRALGKRHLSRAEWETLRAAGQSGGWIPLARLMSPSFADLPAESAPLAYLESYALVDHLERRGGQRKLAGFLETLLRIRHLERALERSFRISLDGLESALLAELQ